MLNIKYGYKVTTQAIYHWVGIPPAIITQETKRLYYNYLSVAQIEETYEALTSYIIDAILNGFAVLEKLD